MLAAAAASWVETVRISRIQRTGTSDLIRRLGRGTLIQCLESWVDCVRLIRRSRMALGRAGPRREERRVKSIFGAWQLLRLEKRRLRTCEEKIAARADQGQRADAFGNWRAAMLLVRAARLLSGRCNMLTARRMREWAFATWREEASDLRRKRLWMAKLAARMRNLVQAAAFMGWNSNASHLRYQRATISKVRIRIRSLSLAASVATWKSVFSDGANKRRADAVAQQHRTRRLQRSSAIAWHVRAHRTRTSRAKIDGFHKRLDQRRKSDVFADWLDEARRLRLVGRAIFGGQRRAGVSAQRAAIQLWVEVWLAGVQRREMAEVRAVAFQAKLMRAVVAAWRRQSVSRRMFINRRNRTEVETFVVWQEFLAGRHRAAAAAAVVDRTGPREALSTALQGWQAVLRKRRRLAFSASRGAERLRRSLLRTSLATWVDICVGIRSMRLLLGQADKGSALRAGTVCLTAWTEEFVRRKRRRIAAARASSLLKRANCRRHFKAWVLEAGENRRKRRRKTLAASKGALVLQGRWWRQWKIAAIGRKLRLAASAARKAATEEIQLELTQLAEEAMEIYESWSTELRDMVVILSEGENERRRLRAEMSVAKAVFREREAEIIKSLTAAQLDTVRNAARRSLSTIPAVELGRLAFPFLLHFDSAPSQSTPSSSSALKVGLGKSAPAPARRAGGFARPAIRPARPDSASIPGPMETDDLTLPRSTSPSLFGKPAQAWTVSGGPGHGVIVGGSGKDPISTPKRASFVAGSSAAGSSAGSFKTSDQAPSWEAAVRAVGFAVTADKHGLLRVSHAEAWSVARIGDVLMAVDGFTVHGVGTDQVERALGRLAGGAPGSTVRLQLVRGTASMVLTVSRGPHTPASRRNSRSATSTGRCDSAGDVNAACSPAGDGGEKLTSADLQGRRESGTAGEDGNRGSGGKKLSIATEHFAGGGDAASDDEGSASQAGRPVVQGSYASTMRAARRGAERSAPPTAWPSE
mmetsp:Transcript_30468/g.81133  ORF Transcript_30468/g.81133 Transcript_30468/m.81133 type:complete len:984 (-) Transcript_30468:68-3019(-)